MAWVNPTGCTSVPPGYKDWDNPTNAINGSTATSSSHASFSTGQWTEWLTATRAAMNVDKIQLYLVCGRVTCQMEVQGYWDGAWNAIYTGNTWDYAYQEKALPGGCHLMSAMRLRWQGCAGVPSKNLRVHVIQWNGGCTPTVYWDLITSSGSGGSVTTPGEGTFVDYTDGQMVDIVATPDPGYSFANWSGDTGDITDVNDETTQIQMNADYSIVANFASMGKPAAFASPARVGAALASGMM